MGNRPPKEYRIYKPGDGNTYVYDVISWTGSYWARDKGCVHDNGLGAKPGNIGNFHRTPDIEDINYERTDLVYYCSNILESVEKSYKGYTRRREKDIIIVEGKLDKPYVRLGTFTIAGPKPPDVKKVKDHLLTRARGVFGSDAVIVERWEILPFDKDKYWPITKFEDDEYVLFHCIAVAFEETADIPDYLKILVTKEDYKFPYEEIEQFTVDVKNNDSYYVFELDLKEKVYDKCKPNVPDAVKIIKEEELSKGGLFSKGTTRCHCIAISFDERINQQLIVPPDADIEEFQKEPLKY